MKTLIRILQKLLTLSLFPIYEWVANIEKQAPECCGKISDFQGHHTSLFDEVFYYQCPDCKKTFVKHNEHNAVTLGKLWRLIYMPKGK